MDILEIKKRLKEKNTYLKKAFYVKEIGIFGSFINNKQEVYSDVDILVSFAKGHKDLFNYMRLKFCLEELMERKVDLVIKEAVKPRLKDRIFSEVEYV